MFLTCLKLVSQELQTNQPNSELHIHRTQGLAWIQSTKF